MRRTKSPMFRPGDPATAGQWLQDAQAIELAAVGHRVVHGGPDYDRPVLVDADVLARLERYVPLAPLHQPNNLAPIRALLASRPELPQVAPVSTPPFIARTMLSPTTTLSRSIFTAKASSDTDFTDSLTNTSPDVYAKSLQVLPNGG